MKLGEVKAEALMKMGINNTSNISYGDIQCLKNNPTYATYLHAMIGAINRCFDRFYTKKAIDRIPVAITSATSEAAELSESGYGINDVLARMIPLYIVGDVFAMDEPSMAANNRNEFENALEEYVKERVYEPQASVEIIYGVN